jgi:hypothetical protein
VRPVGGWLYGRHSIVCSTTLQSVSTANTRPERGFDPNSVRVMKTSAVSDLTVGGSTLANHPSGWSGGCSSTLGRYSTSWMRPSKVRLSIISRATSGYPS